MAGVVTIGNFDGVHAGHAALLARARQAAPPGTPVVVLAFDPHPATVLRPEAAPPRLTTFAQRTELLRRAGADAVIRLEPTPSLLSTEPDEFVRRLVAEHAPAAIVEGPDFRFGRGRRGGLDLLRSMGAAMGFAVEVVEPVVAVLSDHTEVVASSSIVRWLVANGRVTDAARVLGRPYSIVGRVVRGDRAGRTLGYPTANVRTECLPPADGVYAGRARLADGREFTAAISVGVKPQFDGRARLIEAHLLLPGRPGTNRADWAPLPGLPEYGWPVEVEFTTWLRDQARFATIDELVAQIGRDCGRALEEVAA
jgi:riboflavin kinase/FMN adenylyltransferase